MAQISDNHKETRRGWPRSRIALFAFLGIAAFFLLTEHTAHVLGALPFLLVLACPLLHLFMHGGHGNGHNGGGGDGHAQHRSGGRR